MHPQVCSGDSNISKLTIVSCNFSKQASSKEFSPHFQISNLFILSSLTTMIEAFITGPRNDLIKKVPVYLKMEDI